MAGARFGAVDGLPPFALSDEARLREAETRRGVEGQVGAREREPSRFAPFYLVAHVGELVDEALRGSRLRDRGSRGSLGGGALGRVRRALGGRLRPGSLALGVELGAESVHDALGYESPAREVGVVVEGLVVHGDRL